MLDAEPDTANVVTYTCRLLLNAEISCGVQAQLGLLPCCNRQMVRKTLHGEQRNASPQKQGREGCV